MVSESMRPQIHAPGLPVVGSVFSHGLGFSFFSFLPVLRAPVALPFDSPPLVAVLVPFLARGALFVAPLAGNCTGVAVAKRIAATRITGAGLASGTSGARSCGSKRINILRLVGSDGQQSTVDWRSLPARGGQQSGLVRAATRRGPHVSRDHTAAPRTDAVPRFGATWLLHVEPWYVVGRL